MTDPRDIRARSLSDAWIRALQALCSLPKHAATHLVVRVSDPSTEIPAIREHADQLVALGHVQKVHTVRDTIFPLPWARRYPAPADLAEHYREQYPKLRR